MTSTLSFKTTFNFLCAGIGYTLKICEATSSIANTLLVIFIIISALASEEPSLTFTVSFKEAFVAASNWVLTPVQAEYYALDLEEQQAIDKLMFDDGVRSQAFNDLYNDGDTSNLNNLTSTERNEINKIIPNLPDAIGGTTSQPSMVNQYFANMGSNLGVSSAYMDTYNAAKNKISQSLNLTPNNQQYGYGNTFNQNFDRSMTAANPFFDELTNQGLI